MIRIAQLLQSGRATDFASIAHKVNVGRRTLFRDLSILRDLGLGFSYCAIRRRYVIDSLQFQLSRSLSPAEAAAFLLWADRRAGASAGRSQSRALAAAVEKIAAIVDREFRDQSGMTASAGGRAIVNAGPSFPADA